MMMVPNELFDQLGDWSQIKHEILEKYAHAYTTVIARQPAVRRTLYIDAFAGIGYAIDRDTGHQLEGSAVRAMNVHPPFNELHFVEEDAAKAHVLRHVTGADPRVTVHHGNGIDIVGSQLLARCRYEDYHRALCLLDPYDLSVPWGLMQRLGAMRSVEIFYTFMIMDANRNVLWSRQLDRVPPAQLRRMDLVWGDRSWREAFYAEEPDLFGPRRRKLPNADIAEAFRARLRDLAGFKFVPQPIAMKNSIGATVYYLFFAGHNETGARIVSDVFNGYR